MLWFFSYINMGGNPISDCLFNQPNANEHGHKGEFMHLSVSSLEMLRFGAVIQVLNEDRIGCWWVSRALYLSR